MKKQISLLLLLTLLLSACVSTGGDPWASRPYNTPAEEEPHRLMTPQPVDRQSATGPHTPEQQGTEPSYYGDQIAYNQAYNPDGLAAAPTQPAVPGTGAVTAQNATPYYAMPGTTTLPTVKIALLVPLSGPHSDLGQALLQSAQLAMFDMGYDNLEIMPRDTLGTAAGAQNAVREALQDGAQLILGPLFADSVSAARTALRGRNVNMIAFSTDWTLAGGNSYIMGFLPFTQVRRVIDYAARQGYNKIGVLAPNNQYGNAVLTAYGSFAFHNNIQTVDTARYTPGGYDLADITRVFARYDERTAQKDALTAQQEAGAFAHLSRAEIAAMMPPLPFDAVLIPAGGAEARELANMLSYYDLLPEDVKRLGTGLLDDETLTHEQALAEAWFAAPDPSARAAFEQRYQETYGTVPPRLATLAYDATALAAVLAHSSYQRTGRISFDRAALTNPNGFAGIDGIFRFRPDGLVERGLAVLEFHKGDLRVIEPAPRTFQK